MSEWATDMHGDPYCGECGKGYPDEISSHEEGCTVAAGMREAKKTPREQWEEAVVNAHGGNALTHPLKVAADLILAGDALIRELDEREEKD